jgi:hypothetical protein
VSWPDGPHPGQHWKGQGRAGGGAQRRFLRRRSCFVLPLAQLRENRLPKLCQRHPISSPL